MSDSMDDLLRVNDSIAKRNADEKAAAQQAKEKTEAARRRRYEMGQQIVEPVKAVIADFNARSTSGKIDTGSHGGQWTFTLPNESGFLTLSPHVTDDPVKIKGKTCGIMATLSCVYGQAVHFLLLEDEKSPEANEWVVVRMRNSPLSNTRHSPVEPFPATLAQIAKASSCIDVIVPEFATDIDAGVREVIGHCFRSAREASGGR